MFPASEYKTRNFPNFSPVISGVTYSNMLIKYNVCKDTFLKSEDCEQR
jgi:hypothetical protein